MDRISALPDALVYRILSFNPTVDVVRTACLSKRWKYIWTKITTLDFDSHREFCKYEGAGESKRVVSGVENFVRFVNRVLFFRDTLNIQKFHLQIAFEENQPCIEDWLCTAVRRNVVELDLCIEFDGCSNDFTYPECIFRCKSLRVLKMNLVSWAFTCNTPRSGGFPSLKLLHVSVNDPQDTEMRKLLSCCPVLECLAIDGTIEGDNNGGIYNFMISAPELKTLRISLENVYHFLDVSVDAPKLENFILRRLGLTRIALIGNAKSLDYADIVFSEHFEIEGGT